MEKIGAAVVGAGAVGSAVALQLAAGGVEDVFLLEKCDGVAEGQSGRNSGVVHAGIYYPTGSTKAELCVEGNRRLFEFCRAQAVPVEAVGKLVVACSERDVDRLQSLFEQARANGVPDLRLLSARQAAELEPNVQALAAMHCPTTGIVDAVSYTKALVAQARVHGAALLTGFEVTAIEPRGADFEISGRHHGQEERFVAELVVNAAGLDAHRLAEMLDFPLHVDVAPLRGEYYKLNRRRRADIWLEGLNVYPVPQLLDVDGEQVEVVGVHLTPTFSITRDGQVVVGDVITVGPEFVTVDDPEDFESGRKGPEFFLEWARRFLPKLQREDLQLDFSGIMVNLRDVHDFIVTRDERYPGCVQLLGIDSPGLTSSLAIADRVRRLLLG